MTSISKNAGRRLLLAFAWLLKTGFAPAAESNAGLDSVLTFIDVRIEMRGHAASVLREQADGISDRALLPGKILVMQELERPERFAVLEYEPSASDSAPTVARNSRASTKSILDDLIAPADSHSYRVIERVAAAANGSSGDLPANYFVITNIDIAPLSLARVEAALHQVTAVARRSDGNLGIETLQQTDQLNHFAIITAWIGEAPFHRFAASVGAREFRRIIAPTLVSPYDERLFRRVE